MSIEHEEKDVELDSTGGSQPSLPYIPDDPPDGGYGWICVGACFTINCFTSGVNCAYGVYLAYYLSNDIFPDATSTDFALIGGLNVSMAMVIAPLVTIITREHGAQLPMVLGAAITGVGFVLASYAHRIWQLYVAQGLLVGIGIGFTYLPSIAILSQWFSKKRSLANGISTAGSGVGGLLFSFATQAMINNVSLAWSYRISGIICCIMNSAAALLIRHRNEVVKPLQRGFDTTLLRRYDVLLLLAWTFSSMIGYVVVLYSLSDFADSIGLSESQAATVSALLNLGTAVGRPSIGTISDRYGRLEVAGILTLICSVSCFAIWLPATNYAVTAIFGVIVGSVVGVFWLTIGPVATEVAGLTELPSLLSLSWMVTFLPLTFSEVLALKLRQPSNAAHPYLYPQLLAGLSYVVASACMAELWRVKRREREGLQRL